MTQEKNKLYYGDNYEVLQRYLDTESVDLVYLDPPLNSLRTSGPDVPSVVYLSRKPEWNA